MTSLDWAEIYNLKTFSHQSDGPWCHTICIQSWTFVLLKLAHAKTLFVSVELCHKKRVNTCLYRIFTWFTGKQGMFGYQYRKPTLMQCGCMTVSPIVRPTTLIKQVLPYSSYFTTIPDGWVVGLLEKSKLRLTQPSLAGTGAELIIQLLFKYFQAI